MELFILVGIVGTAMLVLGIVGGELLDGVFDAVGLEADGGIFSTEVIGGFLAAFGFGGWLLGSTTDATALVAAAGGGAAGVVMGGFAFWLSRTLINVNTDATPTIDDLRGTLGKVITRIPADGLGEVRVHQAGSPVKLSARSDTAIGSGEEIVVVDVLSATQVLVARADIELDL